LCPIDQSANQAAEKTGVEVKELGKLQDLGNIRSIKNTEPLQSPGFFVAYTKIRSLMLEE
jgi:hypothetical protein